VIFSTVLVLALQASSAPTPVLPEMNFPKTVPKKCQDKCLMVDDVTKQACSGSKVPSKVQAGFKQKCEEQAKKSLDICLAQCKSGGKLDPKAFKRAYDPKKEKPKGRGGDDDSGGGGGGDGTPAMPADTGASPQ
jgi:hypothetical protein